MNSDTSMAIFLVWGVASLIIGFVGEKKTIGFFGAFFVSLLLSPIIGLVITMLSKDKAQLQKEQALINMALTTNQISVAEEIGKLADLKERGLITQDEFDNQKEKILK